MPFQDGDLLRGPQGDTYLFDFGSKRRFPDRETFLALGYIEANIQPVSQADLDAIPNSGTFPRRQRVARSFAADEQFGADAIRGQMLVPPGFVYLSHDVAVDPAHRDGTYNVDLKTAPGGEVRAVDVQVEDQPDARVAGMRVGPRKTMKITVTMLCEEKQT